MAGKETIKRDEDKTTGEYVADKAQRGVDNIKDTAQENYDYMVGRKPEENKTVGEKMQETNEKNWERMKGNKPDEEKRMGEYIQDKVEDGWERVKQGTKDTIDFVTGEGKVVRDGTTTKK